MRLIRIGIFLIISIATVSFFLMAYAQTDTETAKKTLKLSNGEEILDLSGEWDVHYEYQGMYSGLRSHKQTVTIKQDGKAFVAVQQTASEWHGKGSETIKGELQQDGFITVYVNRADVGWTPCKWEISENGNKILLDDERVVKAMLKRK